MTAGLAVSETTAAGDGLRVRVRLNPVRLAFSSSPWRSAGYLATYLVTSGVLFSVTLTAAVAAAVLSITIFAMPLLVAAAAVVHGCAAAARQILGQVLSDHVETDRQPATGGPWARAKAAWRDIRTWRELAYLVGLWVPLFALGTIALTLWLTFLAGITLPLWYWAPRVGDVGMGYVGGAQSHLHGVAFGYFPHGPRGPGAVGLYVDTLPRALLAAAIFAILFMLANYVLVLTARMHARVGRAVLGPPADPLSEVRKVLARPGPLGPLTPGSRG